MPTHVSNVLAQVNLQYNSASQHKSDHLKQNTIGSFSFNND